MTVVCCHRYSLYYLLPMYQHNAYNDPHPAPAQQVLVFFCYLGSNVFFTTRMTSIVTCCITLAPECYQTDLLASLSNTCRSTNRSTYHVHGDVDNPRKQTHIPHRRSGRSSSHNPYRLSRPTRELLVEQQRQAALQTPTLAHFHRSTLITSSSPLPSSTFAGTTRTHDDAPPTRRRSGARGRRGPRARRGSVHACPRRRDCDGRCGCEYRCEPAYEPRVVLCEYAAAAASRGGAGLRCGACAGPARRDGGAEAVHRFAGAQGDGGQITAVMF
jgi:hypothetical protein